MPKNKGRWDTSSKNPKQNDDAEDVVTPPSVDTPPKEKYANKGKGDGKQGGRGISAEVAAYHRIVDKQTAAWLGQEAEKIGATGQYRTADGHITVKLPPLGVPVLYSEKDHLDTIVK